MIVWDAVMYWREARFLEARRRLWDGVDYRIVALVGDRTFRGGPRDAPLPPAELVDEIVEVPLTAGDAWLREWQQRDGVTMLRADVGLRDLVLMTDADELVDPAALPRIVEATRLGPAKLGMAMWYYGTRWRNPEGWRHPAAFRGLHMPQRPSALRDEHERFPLVPDAGWHLSYFDPADSDSKLSAFSHAEHDTLEQRSLLRRGAVHGIGPNGETLVEDPLTGPLADLL